MPQRVEDVPQSRQNEPRSCSRNDPVHAVASPAIHDIKRGPGSGRPCHSVFVTGTRRTRQEPLGSAPDFGGRSPRAGNEASGFAPALWCYAYKLATATSAHQPVLEEPMATAVKNMLDTYPADLGGVDREKLAR